MSKDPAFLFYPGDYLRDTQCLSEKAQVAYDRIMCEHMRNICISQQQLNFFTKRLSEDEKEELLMTLTRIDGGFQIHWVAESILKRRAYSDSRRKNRSKKDENICKTYVEHMENENEIEIEDDIKTKNKKFIVPTPEEVKEYATSINFIIDGNKFCDYYEARGWMIGKNKMKCWKAAVRTWMRTKNENKEEKKSIWEKNMEKARRGEY